MPVKCIPFNKLAERAGVTPGNNYPFRVTFRPLNLTVGASEGQTILEVCEVNRIPIDHACGGNCACSTCHVIIRNGAERLSPQDEDEAIQLDEAEGLTSTSRLACQAKIYGDIEVEIPASSKAFRAGSD